MVRVEIGGRPIIDISGVEENEDGSHSFISGVRRRVSRSNREMRFGWETVEPRLVITSDTDDFDTAILEHFQLEGFQIWYLPYSGDHDAYHRQLQHLADPLELGEKYAIVAYGDAAALCLEACMSPMPKLAAMVAYYPPYLPTTSTNFPPTLNVLIHLAGSQKFGTRHPSFRYPSTHPGFAESDLEEYSKPDARVAWSRTLGVLRNGFGIEENLEGIWDNHTRLEFEEKDADATMKTMVPEPYVNHVPTMTGGIGAQDLKRFYADYFIPGNPPDLKIKLLSRTTGVDRVVDEMLVKFTHTTEMPWMLPGIPPTGKRVEVALVSVVCIRGAKLYHEHIHWDQATVLVQVGLLDPKYIPPSFKTIEAGQEKNVKRLPVCGREAARKVVDEFRGESNELIPGWNEKRSSS